MVARIAQPHIPHSDSFVSFLLSRFEMCCDGLHGAKHFCPPFFSLFDFGCGCGVRTPCAAPHLSAPWKRQAATNESVSNNTNCNRFLLLLYFSSRVFPRAGAFESFFHKQRNNVCLFLPFRLRLYLYIARIQCGRFGWFGAHNWNLFCYANCQRDTIYACGVSMLLLLTVTRRYVDRRNGSNRTITIFKK